MSDPMIQVMRQNVDLGRRVGQSEVTEVGPDWGLIAGRRQLLPELRGFWPMSSIDDTGAVYDLSGQGRTLTNNGTTPRGIYNNIVPYIDFNGSSQSLSAADANWQDTTGGLFVGGWFYFDAVASNRSLISKLGVSGTFAYELLLISTSVIRFQVSTNTTTLVTVDSTVAIATGAWYFCAGRFTPSSELAVWTNTTGGVVTKNTNTTSIPASIAASSVSLFIGRRGAGVGSELYFDGRAALCTLCADDVPDLAIETMYLNDLPFFR